MTFEEFAANVRGWAMAQNIYENTTARDQLNKTLNKMAALARAHSYQEPQAISQSIGDALVRLVNYCHMADIDLHKAMQDGWNEIKDRKCPIAAGGAFVKE